MAVEYRCCELDFFVHILIIVGLVLFAGLMSGLTLGLMSMSLVDLEVLAKSGTPRDRKHAGNLPFYIFLGQLCILSCFITVCRRKWLTSCLVVANFFILKFPKRIAENFLNFCCYWLFNLIKLRAQHCRLLFLKHFYLYYSYFADWFLGWRIFAHLIIFRKYWCLLGIKGFKHLIPVLIFFFSLIIGVATK